MGKVNQWQEKLFNLYKKKWLEEKTNFIVRFFREHSKNDHRFVHIVSKQEIESLCTIFRHLAKGGDKGNVSCYSLLFSFIAACR